MEEERRLLAKQISEDMISYEKMLTLYTLKLKDKDMKKAVLDYDGFSNDTYDEMIRLIGDQLEQIVIDVKGYVKRINEITEILDKDDNSTVEM